MSQKLKWHGHFIDDFSKIYECIVPKDKIMFLTYFVVCIPHIYYVPRLQNRPLMPGKSACPNLPKLLSLGGLLQAKF